MSNACDRASPLEEGRIGMKDDAQRCLRTFPHDLIARESSLSIPLSITTATSGTNYFENRSWRFAASFRAHPTRRAAIGQGFSAPRPDDYTAKAAPDLRNPALSSRLLADLRRELSETRSACLDRSSSGCHGLSSTGAQEPWAKKHGLRTARGTLRSAEIGDEFCFFPDSMNASDASLDGVRWNPSTGVLGEPHHVRPRPY
jgi:hypothetical protein